MLWRLNCIWTYQHIHRRTRLNSWHKHLHHKIKEICKKNRTTISEAEYSELTFFPFEKFLKLCLSNFAKRMKFAQFANFPFCLSLSWCLIPVKNFGISRRSSCELRYHSKWILAKNGKKNFLLLFKLRRLREIICKKMGKKLFYFLR